MKPAYYNEFDPYAAQWLRNLIARGLIAPGDVDERNIIDVRADDLRGYGQCHFFAGIGGWSYSMRMAGWPDDRPVWTGSCPCQPFSIAGKQRGSDDERHLWPAFFDLIRERRPSSVFGEQVAGAAGFAWLDHVCADLEGAGYAVAAADLCAAGIGAPHIRQRIYWVANDNAAGCSQQRIKELLGRGTDGAVADVPLHDTRGVGHPAGAGPQGREHPWKRVDAQLQTTERAGPFGAWDDIEWISCSDGKARPTKPGIFPLAHGIPNRVGRLRAYGNAIVPQIAAVFVMAANR